MTIKVISEKPLKTKRVTCHNCGYELEFTGEDVSGFVDSDGDSYQHIICPREACKNLYDKTPTKISVRWP